MVVALSSCTSPYVGHPTFNLPSDQMEVGVGIHGEPGRYRTALVSANQIVDILMEPIVRDLACRQMNASWFSVVASAERPARGSLSYFGTSTTCYNNARSSSSAN